ncbi:AfsR/SARP family transcriptional regulator [Paeniglutamicibacter terrestris]|uniref:Bacterial transcriptional activator domain-containing protein n=1 Tax=Paeniglutamicibacter terrestris TaxID=2723403 RepID=A0ABX1G7A7_9MICC|nr:bacterial transcriptional activator domain-containing protein [Paeniglutamicibacter terrestris]NKG22137.1 hypothetical protein [Paeniglutamicibacter terrestris]
MSIEGGLRQSHYGLCLMPSWGLWRNGCEIEVSLRQQRLLAVLAVQGCCRRELVAGMLWPESPESSALDNLRVSIHRVTSGLPDLIRADRHALELSEWVRVDLHREWEKLEGSAVAGERKHPGTTPLLLGWYEDWVLNEQVRLLQARTAYWRRTAAQCLARHDYAGTVESAAQGLFLDVLDEAALEIMVVAQLALGQCVSALQAIIGFRSRARKELGIAGSPTLDRLETQVRRVANASYAGFSVGGPDRWSI